MAAPIPKSKRPVLLSNLEGHGDTINKAVGVPTEDAVISVSDDKTLRVWVKRDSGQYWPSICQAYEASASAVVYHHASQRLFVGLGNGTIHEYRLSRDLNRLEPKRTYLAHSNRVTALKYIPELEWLLSVSRDKLFQWHCTKTGRKLGAFDAHAWCLAVEYDATNKYAFVADFSGQINVLKLDTSGFQLITTLRGHQSSIRSLSYDAEKRVLFSGGFDQIIVVWDIGSQKGTAYELTGHKEKIVALAYSSSAQKLLSSSEDGCMGIWNLEGERVETAEWGAGSSCEKCGIPFFWNVKEMWSKKTVGVRQHHCRKCGRALCGKCSDQTSTFPPMGFEIPVRMCQDCHSAITTDDRSPMANFHEFQTAITCMDLDDERSSLVTTSNKVIKVWDVRAMLS